MLHFIGLITHNLQLVVEHGGYALLFVVTILEGLPIIGQFIPGHTIVLISGFLAKIGILNIYIVVPVVVVSAMIGDVVGFLVGRKYGFAFLTKFGSIFFLKKEYIEKATNLVKEHPAKTIILGRFSPITRPLSPFIVGASGTNSKKFWLYDLLAVLIWALPSIAIGYIFGASYHVVAPIFGKYVFIAFIMAIFIIWGYRFINKQFHIFAKYDLITLGINLAGLYLFFKTVQDALTDKVFLLQLDLYINDFFLKYATDPYLNVMNYITNIFSPTTITLASFAFILYFISNRKYYFATVSTLSIGGGYVFTFLIKNLVMRLRPENAFIDAVGYSFPSGHAVAATIFFTLLIYFFIVKIKSMHTRELLISVCVIIILLVSFSRVYLGVHWLSDVFAGIGLGLFWTTFVILTLKYANMVVDILSVRSGSSK